MTPTSDVPSPLGQSPIRGLLLRRGVLLAIVGGWATILLSIVAASLPYNPLTLDLPAERGIRMLMPEGWGFFTRDPREPDITTYVKSKGSWYRSPNMPIANAANLFGINRFPRAQSVELGMLLHDVPAEWWRPCRSNIDACLQSIPAKPVTNTSPFPVFRDTIGLVRQEPIPWAWAAHRNSITMPAFIVILQVNVAPEH